MTRKTHHPADPPETAFTAVLCQFCNTDTELPVLQSLRDTIRRCPHGILLTSGCVVGRLWCRSIRTRTPRLAGPIVLVQPCTKARQPVGPAIPVGPLRTIEDLTALGNWLERSPHNHRGLPARLRQLQDHKQDASQN
jgi:hypothetical protein